MPYGGAKKTIATPDNLPLSETDTNMIEVDGKSFTSQFVVESLEPYVSEERQSRINHVLSNRTRSVVPVVEGLHNSGNISAVMRSAEGMGFHDFHLIENQEYFKNSSRTSQGAEKWLNVSRWENTPTCFQHLKSQGYQIVVTELGAKDSLLEVDFTQKSAIVFGNEARGISPDALRLADQRCMLPILGFVESYNISVAGALCLQVALQQREQKLGKSGDLSPEDFLDLKAHYYAKSVRAAGAMLEKFRNEK